jgi:hypothetical protein
MDEEQDNGRQNPGEMGVAEENTSLPAPRLGEQTESAPFSAGPRNGLQQEEGVGQTATAQEMLLMSDDGQPGGPPGEEEEDFGGGEENEPAYNNSTPPPVSLSWFLF